MDILILVFLPIIILVGLITSYQDIKFGKIKNKWIIWSLVYVILVYMLFILFYSLSGEINTGYLIELGTNFLFAILIGFGLWYLNIWTAGDGKLFIAFVALIPLSVYTYSYYKYTPSLVLLINIFFPAATIMFFLMMFKTKIRDLKKVSIEFLKEFFRPKQVLKSIIGLFAIFWVLEILLSLLGLENILILQFLLTMIIFLIIGKTLKDKALYPMLAISILRLIIDKSVYSLSFLTNFLILILIWRFAIGFLRGGLAKLGHEVFSREVNINKLEPGMVLSEVIIKKPKITEKELKELKKQPSIDLIEYNKEYYIKKPKSPLDFNRFIDEEPEGLTKDQIKQIKKIGIDKIKISQTIPFAHFIFIGTLLTLIFRGNILNFLKSLFS